jgi:hypothetical protein
VQFESRAGGSPGSAVLWCGSALTLCPANRASQLANVLWIGLHLSTPSPHRSAVVCISHAPQSFQIQPTRSESRASTRIHALRALASTPHPPSLLACSRNVIHHLAQADVKGFAVPLPTEHIFTSASSSQHSRRRHQAFAISPNCRLPVNGRSCRNRLLPPWQQTGRYPPSSPSSCSIAAYLPSRSLLRP